MRVLLMALLALAFPACESPKLVMVEAKPPTVSLRPGEKQSVAWMVKGRATSLWDTDYYQGTVSFTVTAPDGLLVTPSNWEVEMKKGPHDNAVTAETSISAGEELAAGQHTVIVTATTKGGKSATATLPVTIGR